ncbi:YciI family protein [Hyphococcus sp.]|uniref:YciI family protein n=1 Tax=Hyphococcus sp. TaxID=2038636 RepID=UPI003CCC1F79
MKIMLLANETPQDFALRDNKDKFDAYMGEWYAYGDALKNEGVLLDGAALEPPSSATVVSVRNGERAVEDGPFADAKEQLGGFFIIEAPDMNTASRWAAKCPAAKTGFVDARAIMEIEGEE